MSASTIEIQPHHLSTVAPDAMRKLPGWLVWRYQYDPKHPDKPRKVPFYASGGARSGTQGRPEDRAKLVSFEAAKAAAARRNMDGVGFCPMADFGIVALDFDHCVGDGGVNPEVLQLVGPTYCEFSPSGRGIRAFMRGDLGNYKSRKGENGYEFGFETFSSCGFVTFTGNALPHVDVVDTINTIAPLTDAVVRLADLRFASLRAIDAAFADAGEPRVSEPLGLTIEQLREALDVFPLDLPYESSTGASWLAIGMAIHHETSGSKEGFTLWDTWSAKSLKYTNSEYGMQRWRSFGKGGVNRRIVTARSLVRWANAMGARIEVGSQAAVDDFDTLEENTSASGLDRSSIQLVSSEVSTAASAVDKATDNAPGENKEEKPKRFAAVQAGELIRTKPTGNWLIKGVLPRGDLAVLFGESGSGKSFIALDIAMALALGKPWRDHRVTQCRVAILAAEGQRSYWKRLDAYGKYHGVDMNQLPLFVLPHRPQFQLRDDVRDVATSLRDLGPVDLLIIDTLAQVTPGINENSGEDMGPVLENCLRLTKATGATVMFVHHSGKDTSKGARGWSGLRAAADAEFEITRASMASDARSMRVTKMKDGEDGATFGFALQVVQLGQDEDGDPISSCVTVEHEIAMDEVAGRSDLTPLQRNCIESAMEMIELANEPVEVDAVVTMVASRMEEPEEGKRDTRKQVAKRALIELLKAESCHLFLENGMVRAL